MTQSTIVSRVGRVLLAAAMAMTFAVAMACIATPEAHAVSTFSKQVMKGTDRYVTNKYDFNGDKHGDKFAIKNYHISNSEYDVCRVYIAGKLALTVKSQYYANATIFRTKNGKFYLYLKTFTDSDESISEGIYVYKKGKMKKVLNTRIWPSAYNKDYDQYHKNCDITHSGVAGIKVSGNTIKIKFSNMTSVAGGMYETFYFKYKNGKLKKTSTFTKALSTPYGTDNTLTAATNFKVYAANNSTGKVTTVKAGDKVKLVKAQLRSSDHFIAVKVKLSNGSYAWITWKTLANVKYENFHEGTLFTETMMAG